MSSWVQGVVYAAMLAIPMAAQPSVSPSTSPGRWWITGCRTDVVSSTYLVATVKVQNLDQVPHSYRAHVSWYYRDEQLGKIWRPVGDEADPGKFVQGVVGMQNPSETVEGKQLKLSCKAEVEETASNLPVPPASG
ncbi:hypothetical protein [Dactylosporangium sp. CA-092794]|uniref:hypothetical protein n=1 Tax=Dactylosporangium sp. CA-092794 TaxID=3239929 RepID=UPI003D940BC5